MRFDCGFAFIGTGSIHIQRKKIVNNTTVAIHIFPSISSTNLLFAR